MTDMVNHPPHYAKHRCTIEPIDIVDCLGFNLGNCMKYIYRADDKGKRLEDLKKARFYLERFNEEERCRDTQYDALLLFAFRHGGAMGCHRLYRLYFQHQINGLSPIETLQDQLFDWIRELEHEEEDDKEDDDRAEDLTPDARYMA